MELFKLVKEDYTGLGSAHGAVGKFIWEEFFSNEKLAKKFAEADHETTAPHQIHWDRLSRVKLKWSKTANGFHSNDLLSHGYSIKKISVKE